MVGYGLDNRQTSREGQRGIMSQFWERDRMMDMYFDRRLILEI